MNTCDLLDVLKELKKIINTRADRRPDWFRPHEGLCVNFAWCLKFMDMEGAGLISIPAAANAIRAWPHFTECLLYPIPDPKCTAIDLGDIGRAASHMYHSRVSNMYDRRTEYGKLRIALLDHIITMLEYEVARQ